MAGFQSRQAYSCGSAPAFGPCISTRPRAVGLLVWVLSSICCGRTVGCLEPLNLCPGWICRLRHNHRRRCAPCRVVVRGVCRAVVLLQLAFFLSCQSTRTRTTGWMGLQIVRSDLAVCIIMQQLPGRCIPPAPAVVPLSALAPCVVLVAVRVALALHNKGWGARKRTYLKVARSLAFLPHATLRDGNAKSHGGIGKASSLPSPTLCWTKTLSGVLEHACACDLREFELRCAVNLAPCPQPTLATLCATC